MRRLKLIDGYFTLETKDRALDDERLCDSCGNTGCSIRQILNRLRVNRFNAVPNIKRCESFVPILEFRDHSGCEDAFNTFRLGGAWAKRVVPGTLVSLRNSTANWSLVAVIEGIHSGPFNKIAPVFAGDNHLAIAAERDGKPFDLEQVMTKLYGGHRFNNRSTVTVLEMRSIDGVRVQG